MSRNAILSWKVKKVLLKILIIYGIFLALWHSDMNKQYSFKNFINIKHLLFMVFPFFQWDLQTFETIIDNFHINFKPNFVIYCLFVFKSFETIAVNQRWIIFIDWIFACAKNMSHKLNQEKNQKQQHVMAFYTKLM